MTAAPTRHVIWSPDPIRRRLAEHTLPDMLDLPHDVPFDVRLPIRDSAP